MWTSHHFLLTIYATVWNSSGSDLSWCCSFKFKHKRLQTTTKCFVGVVLIHCKSGSDVVYTDFRKCCLGKGFSFVVVTFKLELLYAFCFVLCFNFLFPF